MDAEARRRAEEEYGPKEYLELFIREYGGDDQGAIFEALDTVVADAIAQAVRERDHAVETARLYMNGEVFRNMAEEITRLKEEIEDGNAVYRSVVEEACAGGITYQTDDRVHCTCVPHLRVEVARLTAALAEKETERLYLDQCIHGLHGWRQTQAETARKLAEAHAALKEIMDLPHNGADDEHQHCCDSARIAFAALHPAAAASGADTSGPGDV